MTTPHPKRLLQYIAILSCSLLAFAPLALSRDAGNTPLRATLVFHAGESHHTNLEDYPVSIDTIAGRLKLRASDIATISVAQPGGNAIIALRNGERWSIGAGKLAAVLQGELATLSPGDGNQKIRSISITGPETQPPSAHHCYKILFKDKSTAIIDPATVAFPVDLESGRDEIPLGTVNAIKFSIPDGQEFPDSIFLRLKSGHVHKLPWMARKRSFSCENISGSKLSVAYTDILGIIPVVSNMLREGGDIPTQKFRLEQKNGTGTTYPAPLQILAFSTPFGRVSLPSTFVASFTIPQKWREQGKIHTIFGECFEGKPDFNSLTFNMDGELQSIPLKELLRVEQSPVQDSLSLPADASVFHLSDDCTLAGFPYQPEGIIETMSAEPVRPESHSSIARSEDGTLAYTMSRGNPVPWRPTSPNFEILLATSGQKIKLDWASIQKIEFRRPVRTREASPPSSTKGQELEAALASADFEPPEAPPRLDSTGQDTAVNKQPDAPRRSLADWLRGRPGENASPPLNAALELELPWGKIDLQDDQIGFIHQQEGSERAVVTTVHGDTLVTTSLRIDELPAAIANRSVTNTPDALFALPAYVQGADNAVRIRLVRGDIITGTFADDSVPFAPLDKNDPRDRIAVDSLKRIIRTGNDAFLYDTGVGNLTGKANRDRIAFKPAASPSVLRIANRDIEAVMVGNIPLPPPVTHFPGLPPALCGLVYLPGGSFVQGSGETGMPDEIPKITVSLSPFLLDATEVTRAQFEAFVEATRYETTAEQAGTTTTWMNPGFLQQPDDPVVCVSWTDAVEFCNWRSRQSSLQAVYKINRDGSITTDRTANGYRLPTESEWEFAAGGMRNTTYPWGNTFAPATTPKPLANVMPRDVEKDDGWRWTNPVNAFPPDPNGIYGMAGNVWEWCEDWYFDRAYDALKNRAPLNPSIQQTDVPGLTHRVMRGGSYRNTSDLLRAASRGSGLPLAFAPHVGFRCARNAN